MKGLPTDFVTSLPYISHVPEVRLFVSNSKFDVELADKRNRIFSFFVFSKFVELEQIQSIISYCQPSLYHGLFCRQGEGGPMTIEGVIVVILAVGVL